MRTRPGAGVGRVRECKGKCVGGDKEDAAPPSPMDAAVPRARQAAHGGVRCEAPTLEALVHCQ